VTSPPGSIGATPALFTGLLDDAGLFPPAALPPPEALRAHLAHRSSWYAPLVGPFVCPSTGLVALAGLLESPIAVSVVVPAGPDGLAGALEAAVAPGISLAALEVPLGPPEVAAVAAARLAAEVAAASPAVPVFAEVAWSSSARELEATLDVLAANGLRAKIRTGGLEAAAFPDEARLARLLLALSDRGLAFKCTAGLHEAVRRKGRTGFEQMGFANILLATAAASEGAREPELERLLADRDEAVVAASLARLDPAVRGRFLSFGTCSVNDPVEDLVRLGLLSAPSSPA